MTEHARFEGGTAANSATALIFGEGRAPHVFPTRSSSYMRGSFEDPRIRSGISTSGIGRVRGISTVLSLTASVPFRP